MAASRWKWAALAVGLLHVALLLHLAWRTGPTYDEHYYAAAGVAYWQDGELALNREHPPLAKLLAGLPLMLVGDVVRDGHGRDRLAFPRWFFYEANAGHLDRNLFLARLSAVGLTALAAWVLWRTATRRLGPAAGGVALVAFALNPTVLAQGSLASLDGPLAAFTLFAVVAFVGLLEDSRWTRALGAALLLGLACLTKWTALLLLPGFLLLGAIDALRRRSARPLLWTGAVVAGAFGTFCAGYGFEAISLNEAAGEPRYRIEVPNTDGTSTTRAFADARLERILRGSFGDERPIPLLSAWKGLDYQLAQSRLGHGSSYLGRPIGPGELAAGNPHPEYYAVVMAIKNPLPWLVLVLWGLALAARGDPRAEGWTPVARLAFVGFPLALLAVFSAGKALMGVRYVLPAFPFLALLAGRTALSWPRTALTLAALSALLGLRYHPCDLMYYNELAGGPRGGARISVVGDDWGQGVRAVGRWAAEHEEALRAAGGLYYEPYTAGDPAAFGLEGVQPVTPGVRGIVAVHALSYWRDLVPGSRTERKYAWLDAREPFRVIDQSVYVYDTREAPPGGGPPPEWPAR